MKFKPHETREQVVGRLEAPARTLDRAEAGFPVTVGEGHRAHGEITAILAELDRLDHVEAAKDKLRKDYLAWRREVIEREVKIKPIEEDDATVGEVGVYCAVNTGWNGLRRVERKHKAKVTLNGKSFCLTHLKRAEEDARGKWISANRTSYHEDPEAKAIVAEARALTQARQDAYVAGDRE